MTIHLLLVLWSGLAAGSLHVLSGADHLAALLPLSVGRRLKACWLGARWGVGHSAGVLLIGCLAVVFKEWIDVELVGAWGERLVGVMLVGIGALGIRHALRIEIHAHPHEHREGGHEHLHVHASSGATEPQAHAALPGLHQHVHTAFFAGTLHGVAGTAHILGVLPAVAMADWLSSAVYLLAFAAGTIAAMAGFAAAVGEGSARMSGNAPLFLKRLMYGTGVLTILVGILWIVIPALGYHLPELV